MSNYDSLRFSYLVDRYCKEQYYCLCEHHKHEFLYNLLEVFDSYCKEFLPEHYNDERSLLSNGFLFVIFMDGFMSGVRVVSHVAKEKEGCPF